MSDVDFVGTGGFEEVEVMIGAAFGISGTAETGSKRTAFLLVGNVEAVGRVENARSVLGPAEADFREDGWSELIDPVSGIPETLEGLSERWVGTERVVVGKGVEAEDFVVVSV